MSQFSVSPKVWFLFGLSGSGKSHVGEVIARYTGWKVYHADDDITPAMRQALARAQPFTPAMREEYFSLLVGKIRQRLQADQPLLVTQGAYKQQHRDFLQQQIDGLIFIWVDAPDTLIAQRLHGRDHGISAESAAALRQDFEEPLGGCRILNDGGDEQIIRQFTQCLESCQEPSVKQV